MLLIISLIILTIYSIFATYTIFVSLKRINQYEDFILKFQQIVEYATEKMNTVDNSGHYESDDETGFFFNQLKELQLLFNEIFETEKEGE
jgi:hypothetical protein|tara:strand:+ start:69 stop:338 length:270 start_codon:yes stop_codon:yes gene_type:complete